jgi:hypothetical protein
MGVRISQNRRQLRTTRHCFGLMSKRRCGRKTLERLRRPTYSPCSLAAISQVSVRTDRLRTSRKAHRAYRVALSTSFVSRLNSLDPPPRRVGADPFTGGGLFLAAFKLIHSPEDGFSDARLYSSNATLRSKLATRLASCRSRQWLGRRLTIKKVILSQS